MNILLDGLGWEYDPDHRTCCVIIKQMQLVSFNKEVLNCLCFQEE
jgi:hypothetical protein